ncbi:imelysin family protein [Celeribacter arenosi]|uniref:Imelysin family protein n=1 Tax=Celeribacter arenosi TaxID=792649 RepID=A0ABP7JZG3_9RHOB
MKKYLMPALIALLPASGMAAPKAEDVVRDTVLPGFVALAEASHDLATAAQGACSQDNGELKARFGEAFDAWVAVSHLRFGPTETDERAFALAFWPDSRGATPSRLGALIRDRDPVVEDPAAFGSVSIAARGFYGLEYLLYDGAIATPDTADYRCALGRAVAADIARNADAILEDWQDRYLALFETAGENDVYRSEEEALQELFKAVTAGLQFTSDTRLGRPLGTYDKPRAARAEARRSGRSLRHVVISLEATRELARALAADAPDVAAALGKAYDSALEKAAGLSDDPVFAGVSDPSGRFRVEILQQKIDELRTVVAGELGPHLGVEAGFNSLDGD